MTRLDWGPALHRPDLLSPATLAALTQWAETRPEVADLVHVTEIDPDLADTASLNTAFDLDPHDSVNCVLVAGRRAGTEKVAAVAVRATTRVDVNRRVKQLIDVNKASFLPMDRAVAGSSMEHGGITPVGLPADYRVLIDATVDTDDPVIIGSGLRRSKLRLPGSLLASLPGAEVATGLGMPPADRTGT
jgi:prolyl-tRNA editing enzyme YbaK/EbsC (Cys-tRNA(Pro) deacylase)